MSDDRPILDQFNLVVADMGASVTFYRRLGLDIPDTEPEWQASHRSASSRDGIDLDFDSVEFAKRWDQGWPDRPAMGVLGFKVASREAVDEIYQDLTSAGYKSQQAPHDTFWGARYAIVEDPDGNAVGLMSPVDPSRREAEPES
jgi:catechol 2,3-dioxygenase-like lactoylglutathione lyase family enzyme